MKQTLERFPDLIDGGTAAIAHQLDGALRAVSSSMGNRTLTPGTRRKSTGLGSDIRGDTSAPSLSTIERRPVHSPPLSPRNSQNTAPRASKRRKIRSLFRRWKNYTFKHTWANPLILIVLVLALYALNPTASNPVHPLLFLSYALPTTHPHIPAHAKLNPTAPVYYGKGPQDMAFVAFYIVVLSFTREFLMQRLLRPLARSAGLRSRGKQSRFMEQAYTSIYFGVFGPFGLYVMSRSPIWYFQTAAMFEGFPHRSHEALFKTYYLLQASYWAQQAIVLCLQLEKPRKDFKELVAHHIVTLGLIGLSYRFHFTYMGLAVYITHDISDFALATSKLLNYTDSSIIVPYFSVFVGVWVYLRHYINLHILYATLTEFKTVGPYEVNWETQQYKCLLSQVITFGLLAVLQSINVFWLFLILRIAWRVVFDARVVEDDRSDAEDTEDDDAVKANKRRASKGRDGKGKKEAPMPNGHALPTPELHLNGTLVNGTALKDNVEDTMATSTTPRREGLRKRPA